VTFTKKRTQRVWCYRFKTTYSARATIAARSPKVDMKSATRRALTAGDEGGNPRAVAMKDM
jgi:hypothetical protein